MDFAAAWRLARVVRRLRPEILHAHDPHAVAMAALARSMSASEHQPLIVASRRVDFHLKRNAFSRWKYRQVALFICASEAIRRMLLGDGIPASRARTIHEGVDVEAIDAVPPARIHAEFWLPVHSPVVGNVGALVPHKGHRHLIDAAALVVRDVPDVRFVILGEGELRPLLEKRIVEHHLQRHVLLPGFRRDVLALHKGFDLFVMSSVTEGLGTSVLDAMACGRPVVATRAGGLPEIVVDGETGLLVEPRDVRGLAEAIAGLLRDPDCRARMGAAGRARLVQHFSADQMVARTLQAYQDLLGHLFTDEVRVPPG
jgi:L-malate glycosyltransferase